jgi:phospholipid/cholesterol/gamma-HCH transport system permease protein
MPGKAEVKFARDQAGTLLVVLAGSWRAVDHVPSAGEVERQIGSAAAVRQIGFDSSALAAWDGGILPFLLKLVALTNERKIELNLAGLPEGARNLLKLAMAVPERKGARRTATAQSVLVRVGNATMAAWRELGAMNGFIGEQTIGLWRLVRRKAQFRRSDLLEVIQDCGAKALPIVSLISGLVGLILAFVGAVQLRQFGAQIYVADLVGIATVREMGAMMTAIIMAGRTGAAFAAQLGTMQVNEEIDALSTFGFSPLDFLVTPRVLALVIMMPFLTLYADLLGIFGGGVVGVAMLDIPVLQYINETRQALTVGDCAVGLVKSCVFGVLIAVAGCMRGMQCGRSASSVGNAATSAVVTAIVAIVVTDGIFAVVTDILGV